jgi:NADPH:quinone reductase
VKAIVISSYGGPEVLPVTELPDPVPAADEVLIAVRAFGLASSSTSPGRIPYT